MRKQQHPSNRQNGKISEFRIILEALNRFYAFDKELVRFEQFNKIYGDRIHALARYWLNDLRIG
jgi:hypothetical protein